MNTRPARLPTWSHNWRVQPSLGRWRRAKTRPCKRAAAGLLQPRPRAADDPWSSVHFASLDFALQRLQMFHRRLEIASTGGLPGVPEALEGDGESAQRTGGGLVGAKQSKVFARRARSIVGERSA